MPDIDTPQRPGIDGQGTVRCPHCDAPLTGPGETLAATLVETHTHHCPGNNVRVSENGTLSVAIPREADARDLISLDLRCVSCGQSLDLLPLWL